MINTWTTVVELKDGRVIPITCNTDTFEAALIHAQATPQFKQLNKSPVRGPLAPNNEVEIVHYGGSA